MNFYEILNVKQTASKSEIKSAYKSLIKKYHPDVYKGDKAFAERKTKEINEAFDTLSDPAKKAEYDQTIKPKPTYSDFSSSYSTNNKYNPYSNRPPYSEPSKYSPYSNRRKQAQAANYKEASKGSSSVSYTERVIFSKDDFILFRDSLKNKKTAVIVIAGLAIIVFICLSVLITTTTQLTSFYNSTDSYLNRKLSFKSDMLDSCNNTHARSVYSNPDVIYYVRLGDSASTVEANLGKPDSTAYNYDYLFYYYGGSFIMFELSLDYEVIGFYDAGELVNYLD